MGNRGRCRVWGSCTYIRSAWTYLVIKVHPGSNWQQVAEEVRTEGIRGSITLAGVWRERPAVLTAVDREMGLSR